MRIYDLTGLRGPAAALLLALGAHAAWAADGRTPSYTSPEAAYRQAIGSLKGGYVEQALPAFRFAATHGNFMASYQLARILSDSGTPYTDHAAAYRLYLEIANAHVNADPDYDPRAPYVARSLSALARYAKDGLAEIGLTPDPARAAELLRHAAQFFNNDDAQFELAKLYLHGEGVARDPRVAVHWLSVATQRGHAGAQAFLADIYARGLTWRDQTGRAHSIARDQKRAFALITVAVEHALDRDRIWIEDMYQHIFCGASSGTRVQAQGMVADWRRRYGRDVPPNGLDAGALVPQADRSCSNGEHVPPPLVRYQAPTKRPLPLVTGPANSNVASQQGSSPRAAPSIMQGGILGFGTSQAGAR